LKKYSCALCTFLAVHTAMQLVGIFNEDVEQNEKSERANNILYIRIKCTCTRRRASRKRRRCMAARARCFYCCWATASASIIIALSFSWLWPRGKQSRASDCVAAYMVITSPQQVGALDASEQRHRTEKHIIEWARARCSRHTDPLFAKMHSHFAWFSYTDSCVEQLTVAPTYSTWLTRNIAVLVGWLKTLTAGGCKSRRMMRINGKP
jgi:hypothetical protein